MNDCIRWLKVELEKHGGPQHCKIEWTDLDNLLEQADLRVTLEKVEMRKFIKAIEKQINYV